MRPSSLPTCTALVRRFTESLSKSRLEWVLTVFSLTKALQRFHGCSRPREIRPRIFELARRDAERLDLCRVDREGTASADRHLLDDHDFFGLCEGQAEPDPDARKERGDQGAVDLTECSMTRNRYRPGGGRRSGRLPPGRHEDRFLHRPGRYSRSVCPFELFAVEVHLAQVTGRITARLVVEVLRVGSPLSHRPSPRERARGRRTPRPRRSCCRSCRTTSSCPDTRARRTRRASPTSPT